MFALITLPSRVSRSPRLQNKSFSEYSAPRISVGGHAEGTPSRSA